MTTATATEQIFATPNGFKWGNVTLARISLRTAESPHTLANQATFGDRPATGYLLYTTERNYSSVSCGGENMNDALHSALHRAKDIANKAAMGLSPDADIAAVLTLGGWEIYPGTGR